ncbi:MAG: hypothetical protein RL154_173 [Pseudomonadota bacterium]
MAVKSLKEKIDVALFAGQLLSESGAQYEVVTSSIRMLSKALGCDNVEIMVMPTTIVLTVTEGEEFRTRIRNTAPIVPDMNKLAAVVRLCKEAAKNGIALEVAIHKLEAIADEKHIYKTSTMAICAGLASGGFALIFGGGFYAFLITVCAGWIGFWIRFGLLKFQVHWLLVTFMAAFAASIIPSFFASFLSSNAIAMSQAASVLFLVPGILFIASIEDMLVGYFLVGFARAIHATIICLGIVAGMTSAFYIQSLWL